MCVHINNLIIDLQEIYLYFFLAQCSKLMNIKSKLMALTFRVGRKSTRLTFDVIFWINLDV